MNAVPASSDAESIGVAPENGGPSEDLKTFLAAIAVVLRETVAGFEETVARVTDITIHRQPQADRELVVALQDFDRLQQEFATLSEVLSKLSAITGAAPTAHDTVHDTDHEVLAVISVADLKDRLARHLRSLMLDLSASKVSEETVF
ncbi:hypothetical protein DW352_16390 [Pseudolabrys taiwanensis]|uniref:Uncharacterized protein n=1 Tax=Pseudolabrys taiwanensis TaxID=331696 RepID=A0A345ZYG9_9HYPH|nr:hypothetical protein [Pseudolabrys taiwanensis]AXK81966.1 hypothetical protein DW352_16390 [Pseudolabrys taiwanensis]